ncbi:MAG: UpxY family transcription antiterminator [Saprospiraceae bacterium]|nr:UpxY family transcription antiterminator [Saprospiraceae bacterium]
MAINHLHETDSRWFAIRTRARCEKSVRQQLERQEVTAYVPLQSFVRQYERKTRTVSLPLIPGFVFVRINKGQYLTVVSTPHVAGFVKNGADLLSIPEGEIAVLRRVTLEKGLELEAVEGVLAEGDLVEISAGTLAGLQGRLLRVSDKKRVQIALERLGYSLLITVDSNLLRKFSLH